jgi:hypothetical protein
LIKETRQATGVTGNTYLLNLEQQGITVAIELNAVQFLAVTRLLAFTPQSTTTARPVTGISRIEAFTKRSLVHPGKHEHSTALIILGYRSEQALFVEAQLA